MLTSRTIGKCLSTGILTLLGAGCNIDTADIAMSGAGESGSTKGGATSAGGTTSAFGGTGGASGGVTSASGGLQGTGGRTSSACECPSEELAWGYDGGLAGPAVQTRVDCSGLQRVRADFPPEFPAYQCDLPNVGCYEDWHEELVQVLALRQNADVQSALDAAPILYGLDRRPVDGAVFTFKVAGKAVVIGDPCNNIPSCVEVPAGVAAFAGALRKLERHAVLDCSPECAPTPAATPEAACAEPKFYWMYGSCTQTSGRSCEAGYETARDCYDAHTQCQGLETHACGGASDCADDEYCAYSGNRDCGFADGTAVCLPRPRACDLVGSMVCGCNGVTYENQCLAALAGVGVLDTGACR